MLEQAIEFAVKAHAGTCRKGSDVPYIVHPVEVMKIVATLTRDEEVRAAAVLHDTIEDTEVTFAELEQSFGSRVARLVASESEDKRRGLPATETWTVRKQETMAHLERAAWDTRAICLGDKLANLRDMVRDYRAVGAALWERFNAPTVFGGEELGIEGKRKNIGWYYLSIAEILREDFGETPVWQEYRALAAELFE